MKLGIISDTHDRTAGIDGAFDIFIKNSVALVIHCGDWTKPETAEYFAHRASGARLAVKGVLGNNDRQVEQFLELAKMWQDFELHEGALRAHAGGRKVIVYHGHHTPTMRAVLGEECDLLCLGHSHKPRYDRLDTKVVVNPGSTAFAIPRSKQWHASVAIYDTETGEAEFHYF